jgi:hypothetical protein
MIAIGVAEFVCHSSLVVCAAAMAAFAALPSGCAKAATPVYPEEIQHPCTVSAGGVQGLIRQNGVVDFRLHDSKTGFSGWVSVPQAGKFVPNTGDSVMSFQYDGFFDARIHVTAISPRTIVRRAGSGWNHATDFRGGDFSTDSSGHISVVDESAMIAVQLRAAAANDPRCPK